MMVSLYTPFLFVLFFGLFFFPSSIAKTPIKQPKALIVPLTKDLNTSQYIAHIHQRTPLIPLDLTLNLGGPSLWTDCQSRYVSSSFKPVRCGTVQCKLAQSTSCGQCFKPQRPGCNNNTCTLIADNPISHYTGVGQLSQDVVRVQSTNGKNPTRVVSVPRLLFSCVPSFLLHGLARGVKGMAGLGRNQISLPSQLSSQFGFTRKFSLCLSPNGVVLFGDGPFFMQPDVDVSTSLLYTPFLANQISKPSTASDYFIGVESIKLNGKNVPINNALLKINKRGNGGTKISTIEPYTVMETSIYNAMVKALVNSLSLVPRVKPIKPFGVCYKASSLGSTRVGPGVPQFELLLKGNVTWVMFGANSMVSVTDDVLCLGFVDGGKNVKTSIVIGTHQIEDNFLEFDMGKTRLGFSSSLLFRRTTCSNFNFTSPA